VRFNFFRDDINSD